MTDKRTSDPDPTATCDHWEGLSLHAVRSWYGRVFVVCSQCDLKEPVGWWPKMHTVGQAIKAFYLKGLA